MFHFDRQRFFRDFPLRTGLSLTADRKNAVTFLLSRLESDAGFAMVRELAYVLATIRWETAHTFLPLRERRISRVNRPREWERQDVYWRTGFYGRGYVQLTWERNYRRAGMELQGSTFRVEGKTVLVEAETFVRTPDYVLEPAVSYEIAARGMRNGWFTGKRLGDYIREGKPPDYLNARRIINGTDRAEEIARIADQFELLLRASV